MADNSKEILLKLVIDGKEAGQSLVVVNKEVQDVSASVNNANKNLDQTAQAVKEVQERGSTLGFNMGKDFDGIYVTTGDLIERLKDLKVRFEQAPVGGEEYNYIKRQIHEVSGHLKRVQSDLKNTNTETQALARTNKFASAETGAMSGAVYSMSSALGEVHPALGEVMRRLSPFANGLSSATIRGGGFSAMIKAMSSSLMGPVGLGLAITGVAMLAKQLPDLFDDGSEAIEKQKQEVEKLTAEYQKLTKAQLQNILVKKQQQLEEAQLTSRPGDVKDYSKQSLFGGVTWGVEDVSKLEDEIKILEENIAKLGVREDIQNRISINQQKLNDLNEENFQTIVKTAATYEDAEATLQKWLEADKKLLDNMNDKGKKVKEELAAEKNLIQTRQNYQLKVASIQGASEIELLQMKRLHLNEMLNLHKKYNEDTTGLMYELQAISLEINTKTANLMAEPWKSIVAQITADIDATQFNTEDVVLDDAKFLSEQELERFRIEAIDSQFERQRALAEYEYQLNLQKYQDYENYEEIKLALYAQKSAAIREIDAAEAANKLQLAQQTLGSLGSILSKQSAAYKAVAVAQTIIETYKAATAALSPPPIGAGPLYGPILAGVTIATGLANVAQITKQDTKMTGFAVGGVIMGERGPEVVTPAKEYSEGWGDIIALTNMAAAQRIKELTMSVNSDNNFNAGKLVDEVRMLNNTFKEYAQSSKAFGDEEIDRLAQRVKVVTNRETYG